MSSEQVIDISSWPLVRYVMPQQIADDDARRHIEALDGVLAREESFVLIFSGAEIPQNSAQFFKLYKEWGKLTRDKQKKFCRGAVRVEPDPDKRRSLWRKALRYLTSRSIPYPYEVVASNAEAETQARQWLSV